MKRVFSAILIVFITVTMLELVQAVDWETYTNGKFGFSIKHPRD